MKHPGAPLFSSPEDWRNGGFALYVHWPFCAAKCPYCDFNSHVARTIDHAAWRTAYRAEIRRWAEKTPGRVLNSIFFGGGTPSLMEPETVAAVIAEARACWPFSNDIEITLEANPTSVEGEKFRDFAAAGVNRVSMGVQALNDADLRRLGRLHSVDEALRAWEIANSVFARASFDLIYARQHQSVNEWREELQRVLALGPRHLSLYQLTIEEGTAFGDRYRIGKLDGLPDEDRGADLYDLTQDLLEAAGLPAYETSNHAVPGEESRHNQIYWRYGDYVGVGPGAHGRVTVDGRKLATEAIKAPGAWLKSVSEEAINHHESIETVEPALQASEYLMMGLRLREGISLARYRGLGGQGALPYDLASLQENGLLWRDGERIGTTAAGRPLLNAVLRALL